MTTPTTTDAAQAVDHAMTCLRDAVNLYADHYGIGGNQ